MWPFKRHLKPAQSEIESRLSRLNNLVLAYQDCCTPADEAWLDCQVTLQLAWFARHNLKLSRTKEGQHIVLS